MSETPPQGEQPSPPPPSIPDPDGLGTTSMGMSANVAGALSYIFGWVTGLIFFLSEKQNKFVRFHAMQSILLSGVYFALWLVFSVLLGPMLFTSLSMLGTMLMLVNLVGLATFVLVIVCIIQAANGKWFKLPVIGEIAMKQAGE